MSKEIVLFKDDNNQEITLEHLFKKIYDNTTKKQEHILSTVESLKPLIVTLNDAVLIMPVLVQLQQVSVNNDKQLLDLANLVQKMSGKKTNTPVDGYIMSSEERQELLKNHKNRPGAAASSE